MKQAAGSGDGPVSARTTGSGERIATADRTPGRGESGVQPREPRRPDGRKPPAR